MNPTSGEQARKVAEEMAAVLCEHWRTNVPRNPNDDSIMELRGIPMLHDLITNAILQFHHEQESEAVRELVDGLKEIQTASSDEAMKATPTLKHWTLAKTCNLIADALIAKHSKGVQ